MATTTTVHSDPDESLARVLRDAARDEAPPEAVLARVIALRSPLSELTRQAGALWRRLIAQPVHEATGQAPAMALRAAGAAAQRGLYRAEDCEVDLRVSAHGLQWAVTGQLFGHTGAARVTIDGDDFDAAVDVDATGEFAFADLPAARYTVTVKTGGLHIVIPGLEVGPGTSL